MPPRAFFDGNYIVAQMRKDVQMNYEKAGVIITKKFNFTDGTLGSKMSEEYKTAYKTLMRRVPVQNAPERGTGNRKNFFPVAVLKVPLWEYRGRPARSGFNTARRPALWANEWLWP